MTHKVYKITNNINDKFYVGVTKGTLEYRFNSHCIAESYIGRSIRKYGKENFSIETIHSFSTKDESYNKEAEIVDRKFLKRDDTMNEMLGGCGGFDYINDNNLNNINRTNIPRTNDSKLKISTSLKQKWKTTVHPNVGKTHSDETKTKIRNSNLGRNHTEESKKKIGEANSKSQTGEGNSQFGSMWIHSIEEKKSKKIPKDEVIPDGWLKGRKMKF